MKPLTSGVAIITYNGRKYLPEQISSIEAQIRPVEHIVISDDCSTDGTWEFLQEWAKKTSIRTTLIRNEKQLGLIANFEQAVAAVDADIIFSCDQDDVWFTNKVELFAALFEKYPQVKLAHSNAILVDGRGRDLSTTLFDELGLSKTERSFILAGDAFRVYCRRNVVTGATAAFRKTLLQLALPLPKTVYHDAWLALMAAATGNVYLLDTPTIQYRQHGANLVGVKKLGTLTKIRYLWWKVGGSRPLKATTDNILSFRTSLHTRLSKHPDVAPRHISLANEALEFAECRSSYTSNPVKRTVAVFKEVAANRYSKFSHEPWADACRDILNK